MQFFLTKNQQLWPTKIVLLGIYYRDYDKKKYIRMTPPIIFVFDSSFVNRYLQIVGFQRKLHVIFL